MKLPHTRYPIYGIIAAGMLAAAIIQSALYCISASSLNIADNIGKRSVVTLAESAEERGSYISAQLMKKWSAIDGNGHDAELLLEELLTANNAEPSDFLEDDSLKVKFTSSAAAELLALLSVDTVSGAFIIVGDGQTVPTRGSYCSLSGVYIKDSAPDTFYGDNSDLMLLRGERSISDTYSLPLDMNWTKDFAYSNANSEIMECLFKPAEAFSKMSYIGDRSELGYWNDLVTLSVGSQYEADRVITYTEPIVVRGEFCGVIGVSIAENQFRAFLPETEIGGGTGGFVLSRIDRGSLNKSSNEFFSTAQIASKGTLESLFSSGKATRLTKVEGYDGLYTAKAVKINDKSAFCSFSDIDIYGSKSPFYNDCWVIAAYADGDMLFGESRSFSLRIFLGMLLSLLVDTAIAIGISSVISKPIQALAGSLSKTKKDGIIPRVSTIVVETESISDALHTISAERTEYLNDLKSERERYQIALQNSKSFIFEYVCDNDLFIIYHYNNEKKQSRYNHFHSMVNDGKVCAEEDIPLLLSVLDGTNDITAQLRIRMNEPKTEYQWFSVKTKVIRGKDGSPVRIVASSVNINEEKIQEIANADRERRDIVTGFYNAPYGAIAIEKKILENGKPYIAAIIRLNGLKQLLISSGPFYTDAIIEETSEAIRSFKNEGDAICRISTCDFAFYMQERAGFSEDFALLHRKIESIYSVCDREKRLSCLIGISCNEGDVLYKAAFAHARIALSNAAMSQKPDIVRYTQVMPDADAKTVSKENEVIPSKWESSFTPRENIVPYALSLLEKTSDLHAALHVLFCKTCRLMKLAQIIIYDIDFEELSINPMVQFSADNSRERVELFNLDRESFDFIMAKNNPDKCLVASQDFYLPKSKLYESVSKIRGSGTSYIFHIVEKGSVIGGIMFASPSRTVDEELMDSLREIVKIISAYMLKSRTSLESRAKSEFLSRMSHEIRTPMNAILGMTSIALRQDRLDPATSEYLGKIDLSAHYLLSLINDILDMSRIESGKMTVEDAYIDLNEFAASLDAIIRVQAEKKGIYLKIEKELPCPYVLGDSLKLNQIMVNILGNAVKFTSTGGITLKITQSVQSKSDFVQVSFSVSDTGIGISEENQKRIFNSFEQADRDTARKYGGTGLGLAISSNLVRLLGGSLEVRSSIGKGSEFYFTIPFKISDRKAEADAAETAEISFMGRKILLAEDDELNLEIAKTLLEYDGMTVEPAENGKIAVEKYLSGAESYYDAILMDIRMPIMDGLSAAKAIREANRPDAASIPIIAMTANAFDEDMKKSAEVGMNEHLTKPIDMNMVHSVLRKVWSHKS